MNLRLGEAKVRVGRMNAVMTSSEKSTVSLLRARRFLLGEG